MRRRCWCRFNILNHDVVGGKSSILKMELFVVQSHKGWARWLHVNFVVPTGQLLRNKCLGNYWETNVRAGISLSIFFIWHVKISWFERWDNSWWIFWQPFEYFGSSPLCLIFFILSDSIWNQSVQDCCGVKAGENSLESRQWRITCNLVLTKFNSYFHCFGLKFGALGVLPGARTRPYVLACCMGSDYSYCIALEQKCLKRLCHCFPLTKFHQNTE